MEPTSSTAAATAMENVPTDFGTSEDSEISEKDRRADPLLYSLPPFPASESFCFDNPVWKPVSVPFRCNMTPRDVIQTLLFKFNQFHELISFPKILPWMNG